MPFVMLENDALDRFGTRLEQRFNKEEIIEMLIDADFDISTWNPNWGSVPQDCCAYAALRNHPFARGGRWWP
jgi:hypothetical protein